MKILPTIFLKKSKSSDFSEILQMFFIRSSLIDSFNFFFRQSLQQFLKISFRFYKTRDSKKTFSPKLPADILSGIHQRFLEKSYMNSFQNCTMGISWHYFGESLHQIFHGFIKKSSRDFLGNFTRPDFHAKPSPHSEGYFRISISQWFFFWIYFFRNWNRCFSMNSCRDFLKNFSSVSIGNISRNTFENHFRDWSRKFSKDYFRDFYIITCSDSSKNLSRYPAEI